MRKREFTKTTNVNKVIVFSLININEAVLIDSVLIKAVLIQY